MFTGRLLGFALVLALTVPAAADDDAEELARKVQKKIEKALQKAQKEAREAAEETEEARKEAEEDAQEAREKAERKERKDARAAARAEAHEVKEAAEAREAEEEAREDALEAKSKAERKARRDARTTASDRGYAEADRADAGQRKAFKKFRKAVRDYVELHLKAEGKLNKLHADASLTVVEHERALGAAIRARRAGAPPGSIFVPEAQPFFKQLIGEQLAGLEGAPARRAVREGNPRLEPGAGVERAGGAAVRVAVNAPYPLSAPLSTVPASVLLTLPGLPPEVEYRFVGRDLVLRDVTANLIVDFISQAAPPLTVR
jgi:hypothetical protein